MAGVVGLDSPGLFPEGWSLSKKSAAAEAINAILIAQVKALLELNTGKDLIEGIRQLRKACRPHLPSDIPLALILKSALYYLVGDPSEAGGFDDHYKVFYKKRADFLNDFFKKQAFTRLGYALAVFLNPSRLITVPEIDLTFLNQAAFINESTGIHYADNFFRCLADNLSKYYAALKLAITPNPESAEAIKKFRDLGHYLSYRHRSMAGAFKQCEFLNLFSGKSGEFESSRHELAIWGGRALKAASCDIFSPSAFFETALDFVVLKPDLLKARKAEVATKGKSFSVTGHIVKFYFVLELLCLANEEAHPRWIKEFREMNLERALAVVPDAATRANLMAHLKPDYAHWFKEFLSLHDCSYASLFAAPGPSPAGAGSAGSLRVSSGLAASHDMRERLLAMFRQKHLMDLLSPCQKLERVQGMLAVAIGQYLEQSTNSDAPGIAGLLEHLALLKEFGVLDKDNWKPALMLVPVDLKAKYEDLFVSLPVILSTELAKKTSGSRRSSAGASVELDFTLLTHHPASHHPSGGSSQTMTASGHSDSGKPPVHPSFLAGGAACVFRPVSAAAGVDASPRLGPVPEGSVLKGMKGVTPADLTRCSTFPMTQPAGN